MSEPITEYPEAAKAFTNVAKVVEEHLRSIDVYRTGKQFTIDLIEECGMELDYKLEEVHDKSPQEQFTVLHTELGSRAYYISNVLEVMDQSLPDVQILKDLLAMYNKYDEIKYIGLL